MELPKPHEIDLFNALLKTPPERRIEDDNVTIRAFATQWLEGKSSRAIMSDTPELWESYQLWQVEKKRLGLPLGAKKKKMHKDTPDAEASPAEGEAGSHAPTSKAGDVLATLDMHGRLDDKQAAEFLARRESSRKWGERAGIGVRLTLAALLAGGVGLATRSGCAAKKAAEDTGEKVRMIQKKVGDFADRMADDPHTPLPKSTGKGR